MRIRCLDCGSGNVIASKVFPERVMAYWCKRCGKKWWITPDREMTPGQISRMERMFGEMVTEEEAGHERQSETITDKEDGKHGGKTVRTYAD